MPRQTRAFILVGLFFTSFVGGCSRPVAPQHPTLEATRGGDGASPAGNNARLFYPLDLGNHWRFHRVFTLEPDLPETPYPTIVKRSSIAHDHVCVEQVAGRDYVVDRITQIDSTLFGTATYYQWVRTRQDPTGLYEADLNIGVPPPCASPTESAAWSVAGDMALLDAWRVSAVAPSNVSALDRAALQVATRLREIRKVMTTARASGPAEGELTRLRYPMVVGRSWIVREDPLFSSTIEGRDVLALPAAEVSAYRVRIDNAFLGPRDRVLSWYGRSGMVGMFVHIEIPTDLGLLIAEDILTLEDLSIDRGRF